MSKNHISRKFYTQIKEFRKAGEFTDVTVKCGDVIFKCHLLVLAAASEFFRTMFRSNCAEAITKNVNLCEMDAGIFEEVLDFMYTGDIGVSAANVLSLLEASEFLRLPEIEGRCVDFVTKFKMSVPNTLDMFVFACKTGKETLIDTLSRDIATQMKIYSRDDKFLELDFYELNIIVNQWTSSLSSVQKDEWLFGALVRWVLHRREERAPFFADFFKLIRFENLNSEYAKFIVKELVLHQASDPATLVEIIKPSARYNSAPILSRRNALLFVEKMLDVYVRRAEGNAIEVFSMNVLGKSIYSEVIHPYSNDSLNKPLWVRNVALDDYNLYRLHYIRRSMTEEKVSQQSFRLYSTLDVQEGVTLESPPLIFRDVCMCPLGGNIYLYNQTLSSQRAACLQSVETFEDEELDRGIFVYNSDLDKWFPVPAMKKLLRDSCMTESDGTLYLIGGDDLRGEYTQAYDYRDGKWRTLAKTLGNYVGADCCSIDGKIYVCGGVNNIPGTLERYDPNAGKWESLAAASRQMYYHQAISFSNRLWAMGSYIGGSPVHNNLTVDIYNPTWNTWSTLDCRNTFNITSGTILNSVVFNYW